VNFSRLPVVTIGLLLPFSQCSDLSQTDGRTADTRN